MGKPMTLALMSNRGANYLPQTLLFSRNGRDLLPLPNKSVEVMINSLESSRSDSLSAHQRL